MYPNPPRIPKASCFAVFHRMPKIPFSCTHDVELIALPALVLLFMWIWQRNSTKWNPLIVCGLVLGENPRNCDLHLVYCCLFCTQGPILCASSASTSCITDHRCVVWNQRGASSMPDKCHPEHSRSSRDWGPSSEGALWLPWWCCWMQHSHFVLSFRFRIGL